MKGYMECVLIFLTLEFTWICAADFKWEVINDEEADQASMTSQDLLTREQLIPFVKPKPKPRHATVPKASEKKERAGGGPDPGPGRPEGKKEVRTPRLLKGPEAQGRDQLGTEDGLLPLGVPQVTLRRHLLQATLARRALGPSLPPEQERRRLLEKFFSADNLSAPCKDPVDEDCVFDVDGYLAQLRFSADAVGQSGPSAATDEEVDGVLLQRRKRQASTDTSSDTSSDTTSDTSSDTRSDTSSDTSDTTEGSGTSEELYRSEASYEETGQYLYTSNVEFPVSNATESEEETLQTELETKLTDIFNTLPGVDKVTVKTVESTNGTVAFEFNVTMDAERAAQEAGASDLEEHLLNLLRDSIIPELNSLQLNGVNVSNTFDDGFVNDLMEVLNNYCQSTNACVTAGPEFDQAACVNTGFLSGVCPHKCASYECQNGAHCQLDASYQPYCDCGNKYRGERCNETVTAKKSLTTGEKVGVGVAGAAIVMAAASCLCFIIVYCRRGGSGMQYTYYQDEGLLPPASDPTVEGDFVIDRPIISVVPVSVFVPEANA